MHKLKQSPFLVRILIRAAEYKLKAFFAYNVLNASGDPHKVRVGNIWDDNPDHIGPVLLQTAGDGAWTVIQLVHRRHHSLFNFIAYIIAVVQHS